ncbi:hypothetical protein PF010_g440 [Phytophthora fragariae]|uniref:Uncharacterized protein n=1 Tax=Phytophthora fragariae TaxID=53985 RepID=A0A6G0M310_9STRA|nr:hypothetical protein PF010_g440 [Phytophthora fragariae]
MWPTLDGKSSVSSGIERATASRIDGEPSGSVRPTSTPSTASRAPARGRRCTSSAATPMRVDVRQSVLSSDDVQECDCVVVDESGYVCGEGCINRAVDHAKW